jgi:hypothetical protein
MEETMPDLGSISQKDLQEKSYVAVMTNKKVYTLTGEGVLLPGNSSPSQSIVKLAKCKIGEPIHFICREPDGKEVNAFSGSRVDSIIER